MHSFVESNQGDSVLAVGRRAAAAVDSAGRAQVALYVLHRGNTLFQEAQQTKARADYEKALPYPFLADTLAGGPGDTRNQAHLLIGASHLMMGWNLLTEAHRDRSCVKARQAVRDLEVATNTLPEGSAKHHARGGTLFHMLAESSESAARLAADLCAKGKRD